MTFKEISRGKGRIYWASYPVELAENSKATADLYSYVARAAGVAILFESAPSLAPGVLVYPIILKDSVLYVLVSDRLDDTEINLRDKLTAVQINLVLPGQHAALALIGAREKRILAKYGF
jgi:hypothetical protein